MLQAQPEAEVLSISQMDNGNYCNSTAEFEIIREEVSYGQIKGDQGDDGEIMRRSWGDR